MTSPGQHAALIKDLPGDVSALATVLHGLIVHEHLAGLYGVTLTDEDRASVHVRPAEDLLGLIAARDSRPLSEPREPDARLPGNCRHFTVLMVAMLRAQGTPARARCGFGGYFGNAVRGSLGLRVLERLRAAVDARRRSDRWQAARDLHG